MQWAMALHSWFISTILWFHWQTQSVGSTSFLSVRTSCCNPLIHQFCPWHTRAGGSPPPDVHHPSSCWPLWTRRSLHPHVPLHPFLSIAPVPPFLPWCPWHPISSIPPPQHLNSRAVGVIVCSSTPLEGPSSCGRLVWGSYLQHLSVSVSRAPLCVCVQLVYLQCAAPVPRRPAK